MKVIVFGGNGFLGKYIVKELISRNFKVTVFDKYPLNKTQKVQHDRASLSVCALPHHLQLT